MDLVPNNQEWVASLNLFSSSQILRVSRRYQKFQEAIADLGGLSSSLFFVGLLLVSLEKEFIIFTIVMRKLYNILDEDRIVNNNTKNVTENKRESVIEDYSPSNQSPPVKLKNFQTENSSERKTMYLGELKPKSLKDDWFYLEHFSQENMDHFNRFKRKNKMQSLIQINKSNPNRKRLGFLEFLKIKLGFSCVDLTIKEKMFKEAYKLYPLEIDLIQIVKKLQEIDKLKTILLNPEQRILLNLLAKPTLNVNQEKKLIEVLQKQKMKLSVLKDTDININKLQIYYKKMQRERTNGNEVDKRLLELLDEKFI